MRIDDIKTFLVSNLATYIAALSTVDVPLVAIPAGSMFVSEPHEIVGKVTLLLLEGDEQIEQLTLNTREVTLPVTAIVETTGATEATAAAQAVAYGQALLNCLKSCSDFYRVTARENYVGIEAKRDIKGTRLELEFTYTEAI